MHLGTIYGLALVTLLALSSAQSQSGYWNVTVSQGWSASGYRSWNIAANYSGTPGITKRSSWTHIPGNGSTETLHHDTNFRSSLDNNLVKLSQSVILSGIAVDVTGSGKVDCKMNSAGRGCGGSARIDATCVGERCVQITVVWDSSGDIVNPGASV